MTELFLKIVNMSISASWLILAVLLLRLVFRKAPKWVNVLLWGIVAVRLICPFSFESALSLIPSAETISPDIMMATRPTVQTGIPAVNSVIDPVLGDAFAPEPIASADPLQIWIPIFAVIWGIGVAALVAYTAASYWRLRCKVGTAVLFRDNIYQSENVGSPFVLGIIDPKIYLPFNMDDRDLEHVVAHERAHIRRRDHWWKPLGLLLLSVHWFNPLMWIAYVLLCRDIELACDEKVIRKLGNEQRADYSQALLACSVDRKMIAACPLAFGEVGVKERVRSVLNYKRPAFWVVTISVIACLVVAVCFLTDPAAPDYDFTDNSIASASTMDFRSTTDSGEPMIRTLNMAEIQELESRLEDLSGMRSSSDMGGFTPFYSLDIHLEDGTALKFDGYSGTEHRVYTEYEGKTWRITDTEFCEYLSRICAGGTVSAAEMQTMEEHPASEEDIPPNSNSDESFEPYLLRISRSDLQIFDGPGYDAVYVGAIGAAGTYTIVEEQTDEEGNRWGKLKSGVGWIDLEEAQTGNTAPIAVVFANNDLLSGKDHHEYLADDSEYAVKLLFTANDVLTDVRFSSLRYENGTFAIAEELDSISELKPEDPYVAGVVFYGDMTTYGISFTDSSGSVHHFAVYISGRNGALMLEEYVS